MTSTSSYGQKGLQKSGSYNDVRPICGKRAPLPASPDGSQLPAVAHVYGQRRWRPAAAAPTTKARWLAMATVAIGRRRELDLQHGGKT